jgi:hypothetical protein
MEAEAGKTATDFQEDKNSLWNLQRLNKTNQHKMQKIPVCPVNRN